MSFTTSNDEVITHYRIEAGTPGHIRKGGGPWQPYQAKVTQSCISVRRQGASHLVFTCGAFEFMVHQSHVIQRIEHRDDQRERFGTFNKSVLGRNGRGAGRRRARRIRR